MVTTTVLLSALVVGLLGAYLYREIASGLTEQKITASQYEARTLARDTQSRWDSYAGQRTVERLNVTAGDLIGRLKPSDPQPTRYAVMARGLANTNPLVLGTVATGSVGLSADPVPGLRVGATSGRPRKKDARKAFGFRGL